MIKINDLKNFLNNKMIVIKSNLIVRMKNLNIIIYKLKNNKIIWNYINGTSYLMGVCSSELVKLDLFNKKNEIYLRYEGENYDNYQDSFVYLNKNTNEITVKKDEGHYPYIWNKNIFNKFFNLYYKKYVEVNYKEKFKIKKYEIITKIKKYENIYILTINDKFKRIYKNNFKRMYLNFCTSIKKVYFIKKILIINNNNNVYLYDIINDRLKFKFNISRNIKGFKETKTLIGLRIIEFNNLLNYYHYFLIYDKKNLKRLYKNYRIIDFEENNDFIKINYSKKFSKINNINSSKNKFIFKTSYLRIKLKKLDIINIYEFYHFYIIKLPKNKYEVILKKLKFKINNYFYF